MQLGSMLHLETKQWHVTYLYCDFLASQNKLALKYKFKIEGYLVRKPK